MGLSGSEWVGVGLSGSEWVGVGWSGSEWVGVGWSESEWVGVGWSGSEWVGVGWNGLEWVGVGWSGRSGLEWSEWVGMVGVGWNGRSGLEWAVARILILRSGEERIHLFCVSWLIIAQLRVGLDTHNFVTIYIYPCYILYPNFGPIACLKVTPSRLC